MLLTRLTKRVARVWYGWLEWSRTDTDGAEELAEQTGDSGPVGGGSSSLVGKVETAA